MRACIRRQASTCEVAVRNYLNYRQGRHAPVLGRFIVDLSRLVELREIAGHSIREMRLSVVGSTTADWDSLLPLIEDGLPIETIEVKVDKSVDIGRIRAEISCQPANLF